MSDATERLLFKHRIENLILPLFLGFLRLLPPAGVAAVGRGLGLLAYYGGLRRKVVLANLQIAFGQDKSPEEIRELAKACYKHTASSFLEVFMMGFIQPEEISRFISIEGVEVFEEALAEGKGVVFAGNHFGHWELLSAGINQLVHPVHAFAGKQKNPRFDQRLNAIRTRFGMIPISKSAHAAREMMKVLKQKEPLGLLGDLNVPHDNLFVDFFGKKAAVGPGIATYVLKAQCPLLFIYIVREGAYRHRGYIERMDYENTGDKAKDIQTLAQKVVSRLEENCRRWPDHYFWFNRRYKTRPPGDDWNPYGGDATN